MEVNFQIYHYWRSKCAQKEEKMTRAEDLRRILEAIDRKSYPAYKDTRGAYRFGSYSLFIEHVQGDPFATPSRVSVLVDGSKAELPEEFYREAHRRIAVQDHLLRLFGRRIEEFNHKAKGSGKSGRMAVSRPGQEILERTACQIDPKDGSVRIRMEIGFPARGRTICSGELIRILFEFLPQCVESTLFYRKISRTAVQKTVELADDQAYIRGQLSALGLCAFVANGSVLPRESGVSQRPMRASVPFSSPESMEVTMQLPHRGAVKGMGIRRGITLIAGGGYHGKSTLLKALELGVYDHIAGDGREYVITDSTAVKIRAEDGRSIKKTDISMFVNDLPSGKDTKSFYTEDASGSTSQAANVVEAMESGAKLLLIDEDTSATNFMVRDELMQRVVHRNQEPITPFIERARYLFEAYGISTILVAGSSGAYFHIADCILQMEQYRPKDITTFAKKEAENFPAVTLPQDQPEEPSFDRRPQKDKAFAGEDRIKMKVMGKDQIQLNRENLILRGLEQLADSEQTLAIGWMLTWVQKKAVNGQLTMQQAADRVLELVGKEGLAGLAEGSYLPVNLAMPRKQEVLAAFNRYRLWKL